MSCYPLQVVSRMVMNRSGEVFYIGGNDVTTNVRDAGTTGAEA